MSAASATSKRGPYPALPRLLAGWTAAALLLAGCSSASSGGGGGITTNSSGQVEQVRATDVAVLIVEQNTRETLRHAQWAYVLTLGRNRLEGLGSDLLQDEEVVNFYVGRLG